MASSFQGLKKEDHDILARAARMYTTTTGEDAVRVVGMIPVAKPEVDAKAKAENDAKHLEQQAEAQRKLEASQQEARRLKARELQGGETQPENPGPGQPAMITQRAKALGMSRAGEEPTIARPRA